MAFQKATGFQVCIKNRDDKWVTWATFDQQWKADRHKDWLELQESLEGRRIFPSVVVKVLLEPLPSCNCGAAQDPGSCGHHPSCPMKATEG